VTQAGAALIAFADSVGLIRGDWVAIDGSKFRAVSSAKSVGGREALTRDLAQMDSADAQDQIEIDTTAVAAALEKLAAHPEPEALHAYGWRQRTCLQRTNGGGCRARSDHRLGGDGPCRG
jgi:hypothetical protein